LSPLRPDADWIASEADRSDAAELQAFYEANPEYYQVTHGHAPAPDTALQGFDFRPPADMPYTALQMWLIRERDSGRLVGEVSVATDLMAPGVTHLGFFMVATSRHGTGFAAEVYASYEAWAIGQGARWLRLGVVEGHRRARRFWLRQGYVEVCRRLDYVLGDLSHTLLVMVKPLAADTLDEYVGAVPRDRPSVPPDRPQTLTRPRGGSE
jgi:GNAT superfamily N-acetyltransferase